MSQEAKILPSISKSLVQIQHKAVVTKKTLPSDVGPTASTKGEGGHCQASVRWVLLQLSLTGLRLQVVLQENARPKLFE